MTKTRLDLTELCPCGTQKLYGECCWDKNFKWVRDDSGEVMRVVPLSEEAVDALESAQADFFDVFGRSPHEDDPVFLVKYLSSESDFIREMAEIMERRETRPELIYAFKRTKGLLVSEENYEQLPTKDRQDWDDAIEEYFELLEQGLSQSPFEATWADLNDELNKLIMVFGYTLEHGHNESYVPELLYSSIVSLDEYIFICATRAFKTLRSIRYLLDKEIGADSLALCRSIYESYLHIVYVASQPEGLATLVDATHGLKVGTHEFKKNKRGGSDRRTIVCKATGDEYKSSISTFTMASSSSNSDDRELFDSMYKFLSEFTHTGFSTAHVLFDDSQSLDPLLNELSLEALFYAVFLSTLVLDQVRKISALKESVAIDIGVAISKTCSKLMSFLVVVIDSQGTSSPQFQLIRERLKDIDIQEEVAHFTKQ